jgi:cation:H+ antiporter
VVAIGTSLPELTASLISVFKKEVGMTIGNVIGSNTFNIGAVLGISSSISPIEFDFSTFCSDIVWALAFGVLLLIGMINVTKNMELMRNTGKISALWNANNGEIGRIWGFCCLAAYVAYTILLFI